jgi:cell wall integrity and stress response component
MKTSTFFSFALAAFSQFSVTSAATAPTKIIARSPQDTGNGKGVQVPSAFPVPGSPTSQGCYGADANFKIQKNVEFISSGSCKDRCKELKLPVMALHGAQCLCGSQYPPESSLVKDSKCNYPCPGYPEEACGSLGKPGHWSVWNVGSDMDVPFMKEPKDNDKDEDEDEKNPASSSTSAATSSAAATAPAATETGANPDDDEEKKGPNTAAIAAGVVVGVVLIAAGAGGLFFFMRRRRNAEIEEDHRRNAAVNAFINGSKPASSHGSISMTDSRLDPVLAHRRMSDGSIADNEDYSRRILRVTNA